MMISVLSLAASFLGAFLPFVGALIVFWLRVKREDKQVQEDSDKELKSLIRLVNIDVYLNINKLEVINENPEISEELRAFSELYKTNWVAARSRLTQLLSFEELSKFAAYYGSIYEIEANSGDEAVSPEEVENSKVSEKRQIMRSSRLQLLSAHANSALKDGEEIRRISASYLGVSPSHFDLHPNSELDEGRDDKQLESSE